MIRVGELVCHLTVSRRETAETAEQPGALGSSGFGGDSAQRFFADGAPSASAPAGRPPIDVDARVIADLVYRMMRDDLRIGLERG